MNKDQNANVITKFSILFVERWRISVLLLVGVLLLGFFTYTQVLKREGMPPIASPYGLVTTPYFIDDKDVVDSTITEPIEEAISQIAEVDAIYSVSTPNVSIIQIQFQQGLTSQEGMDLIEPKVLEIKSLPEGAAPEFQTFDFGKIDNVHDILFALTYDNIDYETLQEKGEILTESLQKNADIQAADIVEVITTETNPLTGEEIQNQSQISRFGRKVDGKIVYSNALYIGVTKKDNDMSAPEFSEIVRDAVDNIIEDTPELKDYTATFSIGDPAIELEAQIDALQGNAIEALIIVLIVIFFVINWRASLVTVVFIPTVLAATFIGFQFIGYSINNLTLFGFILVLGLFVDDAIVVVEAIDAQKQKGKKGLEAITRAVQKVGLADIVGTITTMFVFIPMAMISGVLGEFIRPIPVTVILALGLSLAIAISLIPFMSKLVLKDKEEENGTKKSIVRLLFTRADKQLHKPGQFMNKLGEYVSRFVDYYLKRPILFTLVYVGSIALIFVGLIVAFGIPFEIFPEPKDANAMYISMSFPDGTEISEAESYMKEVEKLVNEKYSDIVNYVNYFDSNEKSAMLYIELVDMSERQIATEEIVKTLNNSFSSISEYSAKAAPQSVGGGQADYQFQMQVYSEDPATLESAGSVVVDFIKTIELSDEVKVEDAVIEDTVDILRTDGRRYVQVKAKISETENISADLTTLTSKIKEEFTDEKLTEIGLQEDALDYYLGFESDMNDSMNSLYLGMMMIIIVMYALLVLEFNSFMKPLLVFLGIPFAAPLLFPGLALTDTKLSFFVILGITALMGIVINNSIMLLDFAQKRKAEEGKNSREAIVGAIKRRFRPIVATSTITVAGLLPLAVSDPFWASLAWTIIFGLVSSSILVIVAFPAHYVVQEKITGGFTKLVKKIV